MTPISVAIAGGIIAIILLLVVLEMIRRRRLQERYAILWIITAMALLVLSLWRSGVARLADWAGVAYAPALIFAITTVFVVIVLLHYSTVVSRLARQNVTLAQTIALLEERIRRLEGDAPEADPDPSGDPEDR